MTARSTRKRSRVLTFSRSSAKAMLSEAWPAATIAPNQTAALKIAVDRQFQSLRLNVEEKKKKKGNV